VRRSTVAKACAKSQHSSDLVCATHPPQPTNQPTTTTDKSTTTCSTIHQPSREVFNYFDKCFILAKEPGGFGRMVYFGSVSRLEHYLNRIDYPVPKGANIADFVSMCQCVTCNQCQTERHICNNNNNKSDTHTCIKQYNCAARRKTQHCLTSSDQPWKAHPSELVGRWKHVGRWKRAAHKNSREIYRPTTRKHHRMLLARRWPHQLAPTCLRLRRANRSMLLDHHADQGNSLLEVPDAQLMYAYTTRAAAEW
jgi:hypothetical protein